MVVRKAILDDSKQLATLFNAYRMFYRKPKALEKAEAFLKERLTLNDSIIFICKNQTGELVGFTQLYPLFSSTKMEKLWLLNDLFVAEKGRGKGISLLLIERAKEWVKISGACGMYLETEKTNAIGNHLYPRAGFTLNTTSNFYEWYIK